MVFVTIQGRSCTHYQTNCMWNYSVLWLEWAAASPQYASSWVLCRCICAWETVYSVLLHSHVSVCVARGGSMSHFTAQPCKRTLITWDHQACYGSALYLPRLCLGWRHSETLMDPGRYVMVRDCTGSSTLQIPIIYFQVSSSFNSLLLWRGPKSFSVWRKLVTGQTCASGG